MISKFQCINCNKSFTTNQSLQYHENKGACSINDKCDICNIVYKTQGGLQRHIEKKHTLTEKPNQSAQIVNKPSQILNETAQIVNEPSQILNESAQIVNDTIQIINKPDQIIYDTENIEQNKNQCKYCFLEFTREDSVKRHIKKYCKVKKDIETKNNNEIVELEKQLAKLKGTSGDINNSQLYSHNNTNTNSHNTNNTNNTTNNTNSNNINNNSNINSNNVTVILNEYGKEDLSYITQKDYLRCFSKGAGCVEEYIRLKHYHKGHTENSNLYIPNIQSPYCSKYDGTKFILVNVEDIIDHIIDDNLLELDEIHSELKKTVANKAMQSYSTFIQKYDAKYSTTHAELLKYLSNTVKLLLYNERATPQLLKKKIDKQNELKLTQLLEEQQIKKLQLEKIEQIKQVDKIEKAEQVKQVEQIKQVDKIEKAEQVKNLEKIEQVKNLEKIEQVKHVEQVKQIEQVEQVEKKEQVKNLQKVVKKMVVKII
jgi:hypothetical protein